MDRNIVKYLSTALLGSSILISQPILADEIKGIHPLLTDTFSLGLGGFVANSNVSAKLGVNNGGDLIDFDQDLDVDNDKTIPALNFTWRFAQNHQLQFEYFGWSAGGKHNLDALSFEWGGNTYTGNVKVNEDFDVYRLFYGYNLLKEDNYELGLGIGLHVADLSLSVSNDLLGKATASGTPPVPNLGAYGSYAFNDKLLVSARLDWLDIEINDYDGKLTNAAASVQYQLFKHVGLGVSYNYIDFEIKKNSSNFDWDTSLTFEGPSMFVTANF